MNHAPRSAEFFRVVVSPTVREYLSRRGDLRLGYLAAVVLNQMADYWVHDTHSTDLRSFRKELRTASPFFALIADVADAAKHVKLDRANRILTSAEQVTEARGLFNAPFGQGVFNEAWVVSVKLNDGTTLALDEAVGAVLEMWRQKIEGP